MWCLCRAPWHSLAECCKLKYNKNTVKQTTVVEKVTGSWMPLKYCTPYNNLDQYCKSIYSNWNWYCKLIYSNLNVTGSWMPVKYCTPYSSLDWYCKLTYSTLDWYCNWINSSADWYCKPIYSKGTVNYITVIYWHPAASKLL